MKAWTFGQDNGWTIVAKMYRTRKSMERAISRDAQTALAAQTAAACLPDYTQKICTLYFNEHDYDEGYLAHELTHYAINVECNRKLQRMLPEEAIAERIETNMRRMAGVLAM